MLFGGMGPVASLGDGASAGLKAFAGAHAIECGVVFIAVVGLVLAPVGSDVLQRFHLDQSR